MGKLMRPREAHKFLVDRGLEVTPGTMEGWRKSKGRRGPKFLKVAGKVYYKQEDLEKFLKGE